MLDDDGRELPPGRTGALYARHVATPDFIAPYSHNDAARRALERDGLWTLGDMGYLDDEGSSSSSTASPTWSSPAA